MSSITFYGGIAGAEQFIRQVHDETGLKVSCGSVATQLDRHRCEDLDVVLDGPPSFLIAAMKDPDGANLDRVQIIKGWMNADGTTEERVYDVALSDGREDGSVPVGNTVDLSTGQYTNDIGDAMLSAVWDDPDFDPAQPAFYYARVLEIPTPRYSLFDAIALGIEVEESGHPATIQEGAYTSPIWYTPAG